MLFDRIFAGSPVDCLNQLSPLVALSVGAAVTSTFETCHGERLSWLETLLANINVEVSQDIIISISHEAAPL